MKNKAPRLIALTFVTVVGFALQAEMALACGDRGEECPPPPTPDTSGDTISHHYDETNRVMHPLPTDSGGTGSSEPPEFEYRYRDRDCNRIGSCFFTCDVDGETYPQLHVDRRPYGSDEEWEYSVETVCLVPDDGIAQEEIEERIYEYVSVEVETPSANIAPAERDAVVNVPVVVWCDEQQPVEFDVEHPVPGHLWAEPSYTWEFSNGATEHGPGRAYDGTDPMDATDDYYVANNYEESGPAWVELINTWNATFTYEGINGPETLDVDPLILDDRADFNVTELGDRIIN